MNISKLLRGSLILVGLMQLNYTQATEVGKLNGQAGVSPSGAATYTIPIEVPTALSGLQPSISLQYNSQAKLISNPMKLSDIHAGTGKMGLGWSIGGLSSIFRCPTDLTRDGFIDGVNYDDNDQYCLDGQRLILISGNHGDIGAEYQTEINGSAKVIVSSSSSYGPSSFKVINSNGQEIKYGSSDDSRQEAKNRKEIDRWNIKEIKNTQGHSITFSYEKNISNLLYRILSISYEKKRISFNYENNILNSISMIGSSNLKYKLNYNNNSSIAKTISSIEHCSDKVCLSKTEFNLPKTNIANHKFKSELVSKMSSGHGGDYSKHSGDFNGDGIKDLALIHWSKSYGLIAKTALGTNSGKFRSTISSKASSGHGGSYRKLTGDFNGDGRTDIALVHWSKEYGFIIKNALSNPANEGGFLTTKTSSASGGHGGDYYPYVGDFNGDGISDITLVHWSSSYGLIMKTALGNSNGLFSKAISSNASAGHGGNYTPRIGDFNGDGISDIALVHWSKTYGFIMKTALGSSTGVFQSAKTSKSSGGHGGDYSPHVGDFNGDGISDISLIHWSKDYGLNIKTALGNSDGYFSSAKSSKPSNGSGGTYSTHIGDVNGDGSDDVSLVHWSKSYGFIINAATSKKDGLFNSSVVSKPSTGHGGSYSVMLGDFNGDANTDISLVHWSKDHGFVAKVGLSNSYQTHYSSITNGYDTKTSFNYKKLTDDSIYKKGQPEGYPAPSSSHPISVIEKTVIDSGEGSVISNSYSYEGMRVQKRGLGSLGFSKTTKTNNQTGIKSITEFSQNHEKRLVGMPTSEYSVLPNGVIRTRTDSTYDSILQSDSKRYSITVRKSETQEKSISGSNISNTLVLNCHSDYIGCTSATHDHYGNSTYGKKVVTDQQNGGTFTTENTNTFWPLNSFSSSSNALFTSQLRRSTVKKWDSKNSAKTGTTEFNSYYPNGKLKKETVEPGAAQLVSEYEYNDSYGRLTKTTVSGSDFATRQGTISYDSNNPYLMTETNALGQSSITELDPVFGKTLFKQDRNGIRINYAYDDFGKLKLVSYPTGASDSYSYNWCNASICPDNGKYYIQKTVSDTGTQSVSRVIFDKLERQISATSQAFDGSTVYVNSYYDNLGRKYKESNPFKTGETEYVTETTAYDVLNRAKSITHPDGSTSSVEYNGLLTTYTNQENQEKMVQLNAIGQIIESTDDNYKKVNYGYDAMGNQSLVKDEANNEIRTTYDIRGNRLTINDPDKGLWTSVYNVRGQLITHTDAKGQTTCSAYDTLDRKIKRIDLYQGTEAQAKAGCIGDSSNPSLTTWHYDTAIGKGIGKLHQVRGESGYVKTYYYDHLGRSITQDTTIAGLAYRTGRIFYPNSDRVKQQTYPTANGTAFNITNLYNSRGYLYRTENAATKAAYWIANEMDAQGNVTKFTLGNGVTTAQTYQPDTGYLASIDSQKNTSTIQYLDYSFDAIGNLKYRRDLVKGYSEYLSYDNINRLTSSTVSGLHSNYSNFTYDTNGLGNLKSKTGVGTYTYGSPNQGCAIKTAGPHAVTQISGGFMQPAASYCYDKNGSMISGGNRSISYTPFDKPKDINRNGKSVSFSYGPNRNRIQKSDQTGITTYINGVYEKTVKGNTVQAKYYVGNYAVVTMEENIASTRYLHRDHLGSIDAITDEAATVRERQSFDAWGKRRHSDWQSPLDLFSYQSNITNRGFTNHEQLDAVGLVHMNGRAYDPILGRFVSADPFVQDVSDLQSLNRYSYVHNNPLSHTDPSGYFLKKLIGDADQGLKNFDDYVTSKLDSFGSQNNEFSNFMTSALLIVNAGLTGNVSAWYGYRHGTLTSTTFRIGSGVVAAAADKLFCYGACSAANAYLQVKILGGSDEQALTSAGFSYISYLAFSSSKISGWGHVGGRAVAGGGLAVAQNRMMGGSSADDGTTFRLGFTARLLGDSMQYYIESNNTDLQGGAEPTPGPGMQVDKVKGTIESTSITGINKTNVGITARYNTSGALIDSNGELVTGWSKQLYETSITMQTLSKIPGMNYMAGFHDTWMQGANGLIVQITIPHAMLATYTMFEQQERQRSYMESLVTN